MWTGRQNIVGDKSIAAEERELQEEFPIAEETDYISQRQEGEQNAVLPAEGQHLLSLYNSGIFTCAKTNDFQYNLLQRTFANLIAIH